MPAKTCQLQLKFSAVYWINWGSCTVGGPGWPAQSADRFYVTPDGQRDFPLLCHPTSKKSSRVKEYKIISIVLAARRKSPNLDCIECGFLRNFAVPLHILWPFVLSSALIGDLLWHPSILDRAGDADSGQRQAKTRLNSPWWYYACVLPPVSFCIYSHWHVSWHLVYRCVYIYICVWSCVCYTLHSLYIYITRRFGITASQGAHAVASRPKRALFPPPSANCRCLHCFRVLNWRSPGTDCIALSWSSQPVLASRPVVPATYKSGWLCELAEHLGHPLHWPLWSWHCPSVALCSGLFLQHLHALRPLDLCGGHLLLAGLCRPREGGRDAWEHLRGTSGIYIDVASAFWPPCSSTPFTIDWRAITPKILVSCAGWHQQWPQASLALPLVQEAQQSTGTTMRLMPHELGQVHRHPLCPWPKNVSPDPTNVRTRSGRQQPQESWDAWETTPARSTTSPRRRTRGKTPKKKQTAKESYGVPAMDPPWQSTASNALTPPPAAVATETVESAVLKELVQALESSDNPLSEEVQAVVEKAKKPTESPPSAKSVRQSWDKLEKKRKQLHQAQAARSNLHRSWAKCIEDSVKRWKSFDSDFATKDQALEKKVIEAKEAMQDATERNTTRLATPSITKMQRR